MGQENNNNKDTAINPRFGPDKSKMTAREKVPVLGMSLALALILSYVESLIPFYFGVPGMKLGLCNCLVLILIYRLGAWDALILNIGRILLSGFLFGNAFSIIYSLAGGLLSWIVMAGLKKTGWFSMPAISIAGGFSHNIGQLVVAAVVVENYNIFFYAPALMLAGIVTGTLTGMIAAGVHRRLPG